MNPICLWRHRSLARYAALGASLSGSRLEEHVARCRRCQTAWRHLRDLHADLSRSFAAPTLSPTFTEALWARVGALSRPSMPPSSRVLCPRTLVHRVFPVALGAAAALALAIIAMRLTTERPSPAIYPSAEGTAGLGSQPSPPWPPSPNPGRGGNGRVRGGNGRMTGVVSSSPRIGRGGRGVRAAMAVGVHVNAPTPASDLAYLNAGAPIDVRPAAPEPAPPAEPPHRSWLPKREPGSRVVDDLLLLNPVRVAGLGDEGLRAAAAEATTDVSATDPRLQQKVVLHAMREKLPDVLAMLSKATGVTLVARVELAEEYVTLWADDRPLIELMRDLRHVRGYLWSRSRRGGQYVYAVWQDMQTCAQEEAAARRQAERTQREFEQGIRRHLEALHASEAELKRLAEEDPYLVGQIQHPVVRSGYELLATLSPDQLAQLLHGQTPSRGNAYGDILTTFPREGFTEGNVTIQFDPAFVANHAPRGDVVALNPENLTGRQRAIVGEILRAAAAQESGIQKRAFANPSLETATVYLFRWGHPASPGLSMRIDFQGGGRPWGLYSNIGVFPSMQEAINRDLRAGHYGWPGVQATVDRYLGRADHRPPTTEARRPVGSVSRSPIGNQQSAISNIPRDPVLDQPISLVWRLAARDGRYKLNGQEIVAALARDLHRPLVLEDTPMPIEQRSGDPGVGPKPSEFRWEKRSLRELLRRLYPERVCEVDRGALFVRDRERVRWPNPFPRAVTEYLETLKAPFTLEDMALLARSLTPWQITGLTDFLPADAVDRLLELQDLLRLYGELTPRQRDLLAQGLPFTALTPTQQALFVAFAARQRPFVEPWRFQHGGLKLAVSGSPIRQQEEAGDRRQPVGQVRFDVAFQEEDTQSFALPLYPPQERPWARELPSLVGQPFPFPIDPFPNNSKWQPVLTDGRLRGKPLVILLAWPFVAPYAGTQPPPSTEAAARALAGRLRDTGWTVLHLMVAPRGAVPEPTPDPHLPHLVYRLEPGDMNGQPLISYRGDSWRLRTCPTTFVVGRDEIVRAIFEGRDATNVEAIEGAVRRVQVAEGRTAIDAGFRRESGG